MEKDKLIRVFDRNARAYDRYRPGYPAEVVEDLLALSQIEPGDRILEIGCGTGQITMDFMSRGHEVVAVERGAYLAELARKKMERYGYGQVVNARFEEWEPGERFSMVMAAQSFHWIDKEAGISKVLRLLQDTGSIGLVWNVDVSRRTEFWRKTSTLYDKFLPTVGRYRGMEQTVEEHWDYLRQRREFGKVERRRYLWEKRYSKETYLGLLSTFSGHMSMDLDRRSAFFKAWNH